MIDNSFSIASSQIFTLLTDVSICLCALLISRDLIIFSLQLSEKLMLIQLDSKSSELGKELLLPRGVHLEVKSKRLIEIISFFDKSLFLTYFLKYWRYYRHLFSIMKGLQYKPICFGACLSLTVFWLRHCSNHCCSHISSQTIL